MTDGRGASSRVGTARLRFAGFVAVVLGAPAALMASDADELRQLGSLVMILSPAAAGLLLSLGLPSGRSDRRWGMVALAGAVTLAVAGLALLAAFAGGALRDGAPMAATAVGATLLTSFLEEAGWALGGLRLAVIGFGRRWGVPLLGLVWAAWHLIPAGFGVMFPELQQAPPAMLAAFVAGCVAYRLLLTSFVAHAGTWLAAAVGHAAPNMALAWLMASGVDLMPRGDSWWLFPAPGGLVFLVAAATAAWLFRPQPVVSR